MRRFSILAVGLIGCGCLTFGARAGDKKDLPLDNDFLIKVATCNNAEIATSNLAARRSESSAVKDYATMVINDHKAAGAKLADLLKGRNLAIAAGFDKETKEEVSRLSKLEGKDFDGAYLQCMVKAHKQAINLFENQVKNGQEQDIRSFATGLLPDLRKHLGKAQALNASVK